MSLYGVNVLGVEVFAESTGDTDDFAVAVDMPVPDVTLEYTLARGFALDVDMAAPDAAIAYAVNRLFSVPVAMPVPDVTITYEVVRIAPLLEDDEMSHRTVKIGTTSLILPVHMRAWSRRR